MDEIINELIDKSVDGAISVKEAKELINRAYKVGYENAREDTLNICQKLMMPQSKTRI